MARQETMIQLTRELIELLDQEAGSRGVSRSALVREAVTEYLAGARERSIARAIVEGYERIPPGTPDEWGDLDDLSERAAVEVAQRLDEEERMKGLDG